MGTFKDRLGPALRTLRTRAGLTQAEMAVTLGLLQPWISRFERGRGSPSFEIIDAYLKATGSTPYELMDAIYGREPDLEEITEQILGLLRLPSLTPAEEQQVREQIRLLALSLRAEDENDA